MKLGNTTIIVSIYGHIYGQSNRNVINNVDNNKTSLGIKLINQFLSSDTL